MRLLLGCYILICSFQLFAQTGQIFPNLKGTELALAVQEAYRPRQVMSYRDARDTLYAVIDRQQDSIYCAYSNFAHHVSDEHDPSQYIFEDGKGINCEHIWPQSKGTRDGNAKSDMHHLFPTLASVNQARANLPFGEVDDAATSHWYYQKQNLRRKPDTPLIDAYSELGQGRFEPPEDKKGDVARALFYVYVIYNNQVDVSFLQDQLLTLRYWNLEDPPSAWEIRRSKWIGSYQDGKANPFVLDPSLADRIFEE